jgi:hypothetical protein
VKAPVKRKLEGSQQSTSICKKFKPDSNSFSHKTPQIFSFTGSRNSEEGNFPPAFTPGVAALMGKGHHHLKI